MINSFKNKTDINFTYQKCKDIYLRQKKGIILKRLIHVKDLIYL